jgi:hypothetical protein
MESPVSVNRHGHAENRPHGRTSLLWHPNLLCFQWRRALGIHAGYAIDFPELFPTKVRALGASFCFNGGRLLAAPVLFLTGAWKAERMQNDPSGQNFSWALSGLSLLFLAGVVLALAMPETRAQELPE